ncbi:hypothetical protein GCM10010271_35070 [Streptomyces kurssanovii]|nr:hypothetical protein GCM10010271_35070 [Streptomyces kurssanovii]
MPKTDAKRAQLATIALFAASAVLATVGVALLFGFRGAERPTAIPSAPTTSAPAAEAAGQGAASASPDPSSPETEPSESVVAAGPSPVAAPMHEVARAFTVAWASHDARPGGDTSYDDASRRAAAFAEREFAEDLRTHTSGSAGGRQWLSWSERQVQVTAAVLRVSLPDGAPAPTQDSGFVRVVYKVTETPAQGSPTESEQHVALKLRRGDDGTWRVAGLPYV